MTSVPIESVALKLFTGIESSRSWRSRSSSLAGNFLTHGGVARRMIKFASSMVGHWSGGLGLAGVMACALFAAVSGSSPATVVAIGSIILPAMVKQGFPPRFGAGVITTSGALGILIPPSIVMVMYAVATNTSVGALFIAGIVPGLILATMLGGTTWWRARKFNYPRQPKATWRERWRAFRESIWGLLLVIVVIGGIYRHLHADRSGRGGPPSMRSSAVYVTRHEISNVPRCCSMANMSAMLLHHHQRRDVQLPDASNNSQELANWMRQGPGVVTFLLFVNIVLLLAGVMGRRRSC
jgi:C4-dicarboxylate transporter DctM subunit